MRAGSPAELGGKQHDCLVEEPTAGEILEEPTDRLIDGERQIRVVGLEAAVGVPGAGAAAAMLDLNEPHAALHKPARREQLHAEVAAVGEIEAVEPLRLLCLVGEVDDPRHALLHRVGQLVGSDPGRRGRVVGVFDRRRPAHPADEIEADRLSLGGKRPLRPAEVERIGWIDPQRHRVVGGAEVDAVLAIPVFPETNRDELRQLVVDRPEAVMHPAAERRLGGVEHVAAGVKLRLRAVVGVGGPHRADDGDPVGVPGGVGEEVADL